MTVRQRQPRIECPAFLAFVREHPCCACGAPPRSQAAHIRMGCLEIGKRPTGIGERPSDCWCVPLCDLCHLNDNEAQHVVGEKAFWSRLGLDPFKIAADLYAVFEASAPKVVKRQAPRAAKPKPKCPSRPIQSANRWPPRGTQKIQNRRK